MYDDFDRLQSITDIQGSFENITPIRIGAGREAGLEAATDIAVYRIGERIVIPGSSIKGTLRALAESILRGKGEDVHSPWDLKLIEKNEIEKDENGGKILKPCKICALFGNTELASHITVFDAEPYENPKTFNKTGISIDRDFAAVRPGVLYSEELVPPNVRWRLHIRLINIPFPHPENGDERVQLLWELLYTWKTLGLQLGSRRSVGAGLTRLVECRWKRYVVRNGRVVEDGEGEI
jgi:CRISPR-associated RAMP protein (TIGR02581 family)